MIIFFRRTRCKSTFALFPLLIIGLFFFNACRKTDTNFENKVFDVAAAKEWWYGNFTKSEKYRTINTESYFAPPLLLGAKATKKYPYWKRGISYGKGDLKIVELPLYYSNPVSIFPGSSALPESERRRIARATLQKLLLIKNSSGNISTRIAMFIPTPEYARIKKYDMSGNSLNKPVSDFSGWLVVKEWDETIRTWWELDKGVVMRKIRLAEKSSSGAYRTESEICYPQTVLVETPICVGEPVVGDEPNGNVPECEEWHYQTHEQVQWVCTEVGDPDNPWDWEDCFNQGGSPEDCFCALLGNCGEEGNEPPPPLPEIINDVDDPCIRNSVNNAISLDCKNKISMFVNEVFGNSENFIIQFFDQVFSGNDSNIDAKTSTGPLSGYPSVLKTTIRFNKAQLGDASKEYIAVTILHEAVHAWIDHLFTNTVQNAMHHEMMANVERFNMMKNALKEMFPGLDEQDAIDLTWGGLGDTIAFTNLSYSDQQRIIQTNLNYKYRSAPGGKCTSCN